MKSLFRPIIILLALAFLAGPAVAVEKNGLLMTVTKKIVKRGTDKETGGTRNTQSLDLHVRNTTIREIPAGEVKWTILVKRSSEGTWYKYSGTEVLPALRNAAKVDMMIGEAKSGRHRTEYADYRDRVEHDVIISHGGKETIRTSSDAHFDELAAKAISKDLADQGDGVAGAAPRSKLTVQNNIALRVAKGTRIADPTDIGAKRAALNLDIQNAAVTAVPAGEVKWTLLYYRGSDAGWVKYTGSAPIPALPSADSTKLQIPEPAKVFAEFARPEGNYLEYEIAISHGTLETLRMSSTSKFAGLAEHAADVAATTGKTMPPDPAAPDPAAPARKDFDFFNLGKKGAKPAQTPAAE